MDKLHKKLAWAESGANTISSVVLSVLVFQPIIFYFYDIDMPMSDNIGIALWFTLISLIRGYVWRRTFHKWFRHLY